MRWRVEHLLAVTHDEALAAALDPSTLLRVQEFMPQVASAVRVMQRIDGDLVRVVDRFESAMDPPAFARGVTREMLGWDLRLVWAPDEYRAEFVIDPHVKPEWKRYATASGRYRLEARSRGCARVIEGELVIRASVLSGAAERFAVRALSSQFEGEARLLEASALSRRSAAA